MSGWPVPLGRPKLLNSHPAADVRRLRQRFISSDDQLPGLALAARGPGCPSDVAALADWSLGRELDIIISIHCDACHTTATGM